MSKENLFEEEEDELDEELDEEELDEEEDEEESKTPILDATEAQLKRAKSIGKNQVGIFHEDDELPKKRKKDKASRIQRPPREVPVVSQEILDEVGDALGEFDAETANKRIIRNVRRALQKLSLARYPKKIRVRKEKFVIKKKIK